MIKALADTEDRTVTAKLEPIVALACKPNEDSSSVTEADIETVRLAGSSGQPGRFQLENHIHIKYNIKYECVFVESASAASSAIATSAAFGRSS